MCRLFSYVKKLFFSEKNNEFKKKRNGNCICSPLIRCLLVRRNVRRSYGFLLMSYFFYVSLEKCSCWFSFYQNRKTGEFYKRRAQRSLQTSWKFKCPQWIFFRVIFTIHIPSKTHKTMKMLERWTSCAHGTLNPAAIIFYDDHSSPGFLCWCFVNLMPFFARCAISHCSLFTACFFFFLTLASAFLATILLGLPPSVNNSDINLKGLFSLRLNGMRKQEEKIVYDHEHLD